MSRSATVARVLEGLHLPRRIEFRPVQVSVYSISPQELGTLVQRVIDNYTLRVTGLYAEIPEATMQQIYGNDVSGASNAHQIAWQFNRELRGSFLLENARTGLSHKVSNVRLAHTPENRAQLYWDFGTGQQYRYFVEELPHDFAQRVDLIRLSDVLRNLFRPLNPLLEEIAGKYLTTDAYLRTLQRRSAVRQGPQLD